MDLVAGDAPEAGEARPVTHSVLADALTSLRVVAALAAGVAATQGRLTLAAAWVVLGWATDSLDGPLARRAARPTRLAPYDPHADALLGVAVAAGVAIGGRAPIWPAALAIVLWVMLAWSTNLAAGMLAQAVGFATFLAVAGRDDRTALVVTLTGIAAVTAVHGRRLLSEMVPKFFAEVARVRGQGRRN